MTASPRYYLIGTKYARSQDVLPQMILEGVVSTGFAHSLDLSPVVAKNFAGARAWIDKAIPTESAVAKRTLVRFVGLKPGDLLAIKAHSAPMGTQARLVIARYAVVSGSSQVVYRKSEALGHTIKVDFLDEMEPIERPLGYGQTLHEIEDPERIRLIFGRYVDSARVSPVSSPNVSDKATYSTEVAARGAYLMTRVHNQLQNEMRRVLASIYGVAVVGQEEQFVDLMVRLPQSTLLLEVKSSPSPIACVREALGQLLHYSWRLQLEAKRVTYVVVGPSPPSVDDTAFVSHIAATTGLSFRYCTPTTYRADA